MVMAGSTGEIARIEHELEILRSRYAIFSYWAVVVKWFCIGSAMVILALLALLATHQPIMALFLTFLVVFLVVTVWLSNPNVGRFRRIDLVSPGPRWDWGGWAKRPASEAMVIEGMIAERDARLAQLRSPPT